MNRPEGVKRSTAGEIERCEVPYALLLRDADASFQIGRASF